MIARVLRENWEHIGITNLGLVIFFTMFCFLCYGIFRAASQQRYELESRLPLQEDVGSEVSHVG